MCLWNNQEVCVTECTHVEEQRKMKLWSSQRPQSWGPGLLGWGAGQRRHWELWMPSVFRKKLAAMRAGVKQLTSEVPTLTMFLVSISPGPSICPENLRPPTVSPALWNSHFKSSSVALGLSPHYLFGTWQREEALIIWGHPQLLPSNLQMHRLLLLSFLQRPAPPTPGTSFSMYLQPFSKVSLLLAFKHSDISPTLKQMRTWLLTCPSCPLSLADFVRAACIHSFHFPSHLLLVPSDTVLHWDSTYPGHQWRYLFLNPVVWNMGIIQFLSSSLCISSQPPVLGHCAL